MVERSEFQERRRRVEALHQVPHLRVELPEHRRRLERRVDLGWLTLLVARRHHRELEHAWLIDDHHLLTAWVVPADGEQLVGAVEQLAGRMQHVYLLAQSSTCLSAQDAIKHGEPITSERVGQIVGRSQLGCEPRVHGGTVRWTVCRTSQSLPARFHLPCSYRRSSYPHNLAFALARRPSFLLRRLSSLFFLCSDDSPRFSLDLKQDQKDTHLCPAGRRRESRDTSGVCPGQCYFQETRQQPLEAVELVKIPHTPMMMVLYFPSRHVPPKRKQAVVIIVY
eukprot:3161791-Rhodomonas_salina.2